MSNLPTRITCLTTSCILYECGVAKSEYQEEMASTSELANVLAVHLSAALHRFLADAVCVVFRNHDGVNSGTKDQMIVQNLTNPLQWLLFGGDPSVVLATFENQGAPSNFCGKVFKSGEPAYFCK